MNQPPRRHPLPYIGLGVLALIVWYITKPRPADPGPLDVPKAQDPVVPGPR